MSVQLVNSSHFNVVGRNKRTLNIKIPGNVLMFFKMNGCAGCSQFEPVFHQLAAQIQGVTFLVADLSNDRNIIMMSRQTNTPIEKVPYILLYINGRPLAKFNGKKNIPSLRNFISKALAAAPRQQPQSSFVQQPYSQQPPQQTYPQPQQHQQPPSRVYQPDLKMPKGMNSAIRGNNSGGYQYMQDVEEDDETKLDVPEQVTPYNTPWDTKYKKMGELD